MERLMVLQQLFREKKNPNHGKHPEEKDLLKEINFIVDIVDVVEII
jgi:hypothetical protein